MGLAEAVTRRDSGDAIAAVVRADGAGAHGWLSAQTRGSGVAVARNLGDIVHHLTMLHGRHPSIVDLVAPRIADAELGAWMLDAANAFTAERALLARLVVAVGPLPSTAGQASSDAAVVAQHHALDMLARSERDGCAAGAAVALLLDWVSIRHALDAAAERFGVAAPPSVLPRAAAVLDTARRLAVTLPVERALLFGAQQMIAQHRGLFDLLEARAAARG